MTNVTPIRPEGTARPSQPQITESDAKLLTLDSYVMHIHTQNCISCECSERFSQLFEVWTHPTKTRATNLHVLRRTTTLALVDLEITYIELPPVRIHLCCECVNTFVHPNRTSTIPAVSREAWADTLRRKYTPQDTPSRAATRTEPTLDQL